MAPSETITRLVTLHPRRNGFRKSQAGLSVADQGNLSTYPTSSFGIYWPVPLKNVSVLLGASYNVTITTLAGSYQYFVTTIFATTKEGYPPPA